MKKTAKVMLFLLALNLFSNIAYADPVDFPRPESFTPITTTTTLDIPMTD